MEGVKWPLGMIDGWQIKYEVWPEPRELLEASCDLGSDPETLRTSFPTLSFDHLPAVWW